MPLEGITQDRKLQEYVHCVSFLHPWKFGVRQAWSEEIELSLGVSGFPNLNCSGKSIQEYEYKSLKFKGIHPRIKWDFLISP